MQENAKSSVLSWIITLLIVICALGAFTFYNANGMSYLSDDSSACNNCHVMNDVYASWRKGTHAQLVEGKPRATCNDCHIPQGSFMDKWTAKAQSGLHHAYSFTFKLNDLPQYFTASASSKAAVQANCVRCHSGVASVVVNATTKPDDAHSNQSLQCAKCHGGVGHSRDF